jgi:hypothetical protein
VLKMMIEKLKKSLFGDRIRESAGIKIELGNLRGIKYGYHRR